MYTHRYVHAYKLMFIRMYILYPAVRANYGWIKGQSVLIFVM